METRLRDGAKWRRYRTNDGLRVTTLEVPESVVGEIGAQALKTALERAERKFARRQRNQRALTLLQQGWKPAAVALELGLSESQVRKIRQKGKE